MNIVISYVLLATLAGTCFRTAPAEPIDGPNAIFRDDLLDKLVGQWDLTRAIRGQQERNSVDVAWVLHHQFLQLHMKDANDPPKYEAIVMIGYDHSEKKYVIHWTDTWGGKFSLRGYGKRDGDRIEFSFGEGDSSFYNTFTWHEDSETWTCLLQSGNKDGKRHLFAEDTLQKKASRSR